jgi:hypothetical protein
MRRSSGLAVPHQPPRIADTRLSSDSSGLSRRNAAIRSNIHRMLAAIDSPGVKEIGQLRRIGVGCPPRE